jgi:hypothetical protein
MTVGDEIDGLDLMAEPVRAGYNLSRTREIGRWRVVSPPWTAALGHRRGGCPRCAVRLAGAPLRAPRGTAVRVFLGLKRCGDIGDTHPGFNVAGDDLKVADGGGLDFLSFDGVARPHPRSSGPRDWFPRFLALSSRSYPVQLLREAANLVPATFASCSRVCFKAGQNSGTMAAYL